MKTALLDDAAFDPTARRPRPSGPEAARGRRRLGRWLRELTGVVVILVERMSGVIVLRRTDHAMTRSIDVDLAWALLARAASWIRALQARLKAEAKAAKAGMYPTVGDYEGEDWHEDLLRRSRPAPMRMTAPDARIDDKPASEVVAQICADLTAAATVLHSHVAAAKIAAIAAAARALVGEPDAGWMPLPIPVRRDSPAPATISPAMISADRPTPASPSFDSG